MTDYWGGSEWNKKLLKINYHPRHIERPSVITPHLRMGSWKRTRDSERETTSDIREDTESSADESRARIQGRRAKIQGCRELILFFSYRVRAW